MTLEQLGPLKHLWGATEQHYGSPSGTNSPRFCTLSPDQWNSSSLHTLFSRTAATVAPRRSPTDSWAAHLWGCIALACLRDCLCSGDRGRVCVGEWMCLWFSPSGQSSRLSLCTGQSDAMLMLMRSQWPQLRSQCCVSSAASPFQLKAEGSLFGRGRTGLGPCGCTERKHITAKSNRPTEQTVHSFKKLKWIPFSTVQFLNRRSQSPWLLLPAGT